MRLGICLLFLSCFVRIHAQTTPVIDSLQLLIEKEKDEGKLILLYNAIAGEYKSIDPYATRDYANKAYTLASERKDLKGQSDALHKKGVSYYYLDSYDTALLYYHQSYDLAKAAGDSLLVAQSYLATGNVFRLQGLNDTAVFYISKALHLYEAANDQKNIAFCLSTIGDTYLFAGDFAQALNYHKRALTISTTINDLHREAFCYSSMGNNYHMQGDFDSSIYFHTKSIEAARKVNEENIIAGSLGVIADAYANQYNYAKALETYYEALDLAEKKQDKHNKAFIYAGMSDIFQRQGDLDSAETYLNMSISLSKQIGDYSRSCNSELTMALIKLEKGDTVAARRMVEDALQMAMDNEYPFAQAWAYRLKGRMLELNSNYTEAVYYYRASLKISSELGDQKETAETGKNLAHVFIAMQLPDSALAAGKRSFELAQIIKSPGLRLELAEILSEGFEMKGDYKNALAYSRLVKSLSDSLNSAENKQKQIEIQLQRKFDKEKEADMIEQAKITAAQDARYQQQTIVLTIAVVALVILGFLVFFIFRGLRQKQKANEIISSQKKIVEEKNQEITDSIYYAKNIQEAMLPTNEIISGLFKEHFVFFRPRDIVSGDFYWVGQRDGKKYFAVADCTGHGVPGGFMSMLGITLLNEILDEKNITSPEKMLDALRTMVVQALNKERKAGTQFTRDGMDMALCCIDTQRGKLTYSGANNGLIVLRGAQLFELEPDKQPVGAHENEKPFTVKEFNIQPHDIVVAYTDGYPDQFGGIRGKKLMYRQFKEIILAAAAKVNDHRVNVLAAEFDRWKSTYAQIDDVCVMGIKI